MDLLIYIHNDIIEQFYSKQLVPDVFVTPKRLFDALSYFKDFLESQQY